MHAAEMHRDLGLDERPDDYFDDFVLHVDGWLCEIKDAPDPRRPAHPGSGPRGRGSGQPGAGILAPPRCGVARPPRCRAGARPGLRRRGRPRLSIEVQARALVERWRTPVGSRPPPTDCTTTPKSTGSFPSAARVVPRWPGPSTSWTPYSTRWTAASFPPGPPAPRCGDSSTCSPPQTLHGRPTRGASDWPGDRCGDGRFPHPALPRRHRRLPVLGLFDLGHVRDAHVWRRHHEVLALLGCSAVVGHGLRASTTWRSLDELQGRPRIDVTVSGFFRDAFPQRAGDARRRRPDVPRNSTSRSIRTSSLLTHKPTSPSTATLRPGRPPGSRLQAGHGAVLQVIVRTGRNDNDLAEVYTAWGGFAYGRASTASAPPTTVDQLPADQGRREERRHPRARHRRLRRLLPVPRRHGQAAGPGADRRRPARLCRRLDHAGRRPAPDLAGGDEPGVPGRIGSTRGGSTRCSGTATRVLSSWPRLWSYLFGFDATTVVHDWMYDTLAKEYVLDETNQAFMRKSNPSAMAMIEQVHEAADRGLWAEPNRGCPRRRSRSTSSSRARSRTVMLAEASRMVGDRACRDHP